MTKLRDLLKKTITEVVPTSEEREAIIEAIELEEKWGGSKSFGFIDKYEKILEGLIK